MATLPYEDVKLFYELNWSLLYYVNQKYPVIRELKIPDFKDRDMKKVSELHDKLFSKPELFDSFIAENPFNFDQEKLSTIRSWKNFIKDTFFILSYDKSHTIFLGSKKETKAYGVLGLYSEIEDIVPPFLPVMVETVLLPFKGKIVYNGIIKPFPVHFGGGMRRSIQADFQKAKSRFGIVLSLDNPFSEREDSNEQLMKFYAKNEANRLQYGEEIESLIKKNPSLLKIYSQEVGKSYARKIRRRLSQIGVDSGWFVTLEDTIIASGQTESSARKQAEGLLPEDKKEHIHIFRYVKKQVDR